MHSGTASSSLTPHSNLRPRKNRVLYRRGGGGDEDIFEMRNQMRQKMQEEGADFTLDAEEYSKYQTLTFVTVQDRKKAITN